MSASKWKQYPEYKSTRIEWLPAIPSHWDLSRNKNAFTQRKTIYNKKENTTVLSLTKEGVKVRKNLAFGKSTESFVGHQMVFVNDLVFTPRDFDQTPILSGVARNEGCISNLYIVVEAIEEINPDFINYYWWGLKFHVDFFKQFSQGMRYAFNRESFDQIPLLLPPKNEQDGISESLRHKESTIWKAIEKLEEKIELLNEKRAALITKAVTKGLYTDVQMKDSGVDWIGEVPEHWKIMKLSKFARVYSGKETKSEFGEIPIYGANGIIGMCDFSRSKKPTVLVGRVGSSGEVNLTHGEHGVSDNALVIENKESFDTNFLFYIMQSDYFTLDISNTAQPLLTSSKLTEHKYQVPPLQEQLEIVKFVNSQIMRLDAIREKIGYEIEKFKEFRTALISAAVTGKIDLRKRQDTGNDV